MANVASERLIAASPEAVWEVLADATTLPRWWPRVTRVEGVMETGFTQVLVSRRGRPIRLDLLYTEVEPPRRLAWALDIPGGQFERLLREWATGFILTPDSDGVRVRIDERQIFRGSLKTGSLIQRRAQRRRLQDALAGLAGLF